MGELVSTLLPTSFGEFEIKAFDSGFPEMPHVVLVHPMLNVNSPVTVRIHSECLTGDVFGSKKCDCGDQLHAALKQCGEEKGVLIYLRQEGRGIGLTNKLRAYQLQEKGMDTIEANEALGFQADLRTFEKAIEILRALGVNQVKLLTNNPIKIEALKHSGLLSVERIPLLGKEFDANRKYLNTKREKMGHQL
jgi:3,4-dihydroxy 2-butanone 4-phosphate synthase/GTP cyclohydrolase II